MVTKTMNNILKNKPNFEWLEPPAQNGTITVNDVIKASNIEEHENIVMEWAKDIWYYWKRKHERKIENLIKEYVL
jgi:hypothetical protein